MTRRWVKERKRDHYYRKAKEENYRSRAAFKLEQLNAKHRLIKRGSVVVDLGAAPGGWMQKALEIVGDNGFVVGVDLEDIIPFEEENALFFTGDITEEETVERLIEALPEGADAVISDASPDISGVWDIDHACSIGLARAVLGIALRILKPGGNFLAKVFQGAEEKDFVNELKRHFEEVKSAKPSASRSKSSEMYIVGKGLLKTPVKRGDVLDLEIVDTGKEGDGVALVEDFRIFVKGASKGEIRKVKIRKVTRRFAVGEVL